MNWITATSLMGASASLMLGLVHFLIWIIDRKRWVHLLFVAATVSIAGIAACEVAMSLAQTPEQFGQWVQWTHVPIALAVFSIIWFVRFYCQAGRLWLAWSACAVRLLALILNFLLPPNLNYRSISALHHLEVFGGTVTVASGVPSPWTRVGELGSFLLLAFLIDATVTLWRRRQPAHFARAISVGVSMGIFIILAAGQVALVHAGVIRFPYIISLPFLIPAAAMGLNLGLDVLRSARLAMELDHSKSELLKNEEEIDLAGKTAGFAVWKWNKSSDALWLSENGRRLFGVANGDPISLQWFLQSVEPDDRPALQKSIADVVTKGDCDTEFRFRRPQGEPCWFSARGRLELDGRREPHGAYGVFLDVTARKEAEQSLRRSEADFRELANTAPVMLWFADANRQRTFFNRGWLEFTGRSLDQELGDGWKEGIHPDDLPRYLEAHDKAFESQREFSVEYRQRSASSEFRWLLARGMPRFARDSALVGFVGSAIDITERRHAEERLRQVVELAPTGLLLVDHTGRITFANPHVQTVFGYSRDELVGRGLEMLIPEPFQGIHTRMLPNSSASRRRGRGGRELLAKHKNGGEITIEIGLTPIPALDGASTLISVVDVTERRMIERDHARQRRELAHLSRVAMLGELSGSFAHELNQPLTSILSNAQAAQKFLEQGAAGIAEVSAILDDIVQENRRASEVIRRLRMLFKDGEVQYEPIDLNGMVMEVLRLMHSDLVNHDVAMCTDLTDSAPIVNGDRVQLQQVLINLILNASDAMANTEVSARKLKVSTLQTDAGTELRVSDSGPGVSEESSRRIFEPFYTTKANGMGLGLAICRTIVSAHGGTLLCSNNPDRGASFSLTFSALKEVTP